MSQQPDAAMLEAELRARRDRAVSAFDEAVWCLALGEPDEGLRRIREEVAGADDATAGRAGRAELAVLAGDWKTAAHEAGMAVRDVASGFVPGYREYASALLCLIAGDEDEARTQVEGLEGLVAGRERLRSGHPALVAEIPRGLVDRDADRVAAGVDALLAWHLRRARARSEIFNSTRAAVCLDAVVALLLAHRRSLMVPVAATYRAARLPLLAIQLTEFDGRPLPRGLPLSLEADLVAGPWLEAHGLALGDPSPSPSARPATRKPRARTRGAADVEEAVVRESLELLERAGKGSTWQLASWALILGDADRARAHLRREAGAARRRWQQAAPAPNQNHVREHFGLALVLGDEDGLRETSPLLRAGANATDDRSRRYAHFAGYLDLLSALLGGEVAADAERSDADQIGGPYPSLRVASVGLVERDAALVTAGLEGVLAEHAQALERRSSPPPPVCEPAVHVAAAARRLGLPVEVDERYSGHPVPIAVEGRLGRVACDLLGRALSDGS